jgi:hypothetical protein
VPPQARKDVHQIPACRVSGVRPLAIRILPQAYFEVSLGEFDVCSERDRWLDAELPVVQETVRETKNLNVVAKLSTFERR